MASSATFRLKAHEISIETAIALLDDVKQAVGDEEFRKFLFILIDVKKNSNDLKDVIQKVRCVIGSNKGLMRRFLEFVHQPLNLNEGKDGLNLEKSPKTSKVRCMETRTIILNQQSKLPPHEKGKDRMSIVDCNDTTEKVRQSEISNKKETGKIKITQQSKLPPREKVKEIWRSILDTTEKVRQSEIPSGYSILERIQSFDLPGRINETYMERQISADSGITESGIDVDFVESGNEGKRKRNPSSISYRCSKERSRLRNIQYIKVEPGRKIRKQSEIPSPTKIEEVWRGVLNSDGEERSQQVLGNSKSEKIGHGKDLDSRTEEHRRVKKALKIIRGIKRGNVKRERRRQSKTIEPAPVEKIEIGSKLIKRCDRVKQASQVLRLNGEVLDMLEQVLKITNTKYSSENDPLRISDEILGKVENVLDRTEKECSKETCDSSAFNEITEMILNVSDQLMKVMEVGLSDKPRIENKEISKVLLDEVERLSNENADIRIESSSD